MNANQSRSLYLHNIAHTTVGSPLSKVYTLKLHEFNHEKLINYPDVYTNGVKICLSCGKINIPGLNVTIRLRQNKVVYTCSDCHSEVAFDLPAPEPVVAAAEPKEKKKRKKHTLLNLLQEKKKPKKATLDLMEFMQQP